MEETWVPKYEAVSSSTAKQEAGWMRAVLPLTNRAKECRVVTYDSMKCKEYPMRETLEQVQQQTYLK